MEDASVGWIAAIIIGGLAGWIASPRLGRGESAWLAVSGLLMLLLCTPLMLDSRLGGRDIAYGADPKTRLDQAARQAQPILRRN